jgi:hypothetical protein
MRFVVLVGMLFSPILLFLPFVTIFFPRASSCALVGGWQPLLLEVAAVTLLQVFSAFDSQKQA